MQSISLYIEKNSIIHRLDPISKLCYIFAAIIIPIILPTLTIASVCIIVSLGMLFLAKVWQKSLPIFSFVLLILLTVVVIQGLFHVGNETVVLQIGPLRFYEEGLLYALTIVLRVVTVVGAFLLLVLTTKPSDLVESLVRKGLSPRFGYVLSSVFQIIPQMITSMDTITDAQRSRGMETEGKLVVRMKAFLPLIGPVVLNSLINTKERAMALEVRGFNATGTKTFLHEEMTHTYSRLIQLVICGLVVAAVLWRIVAE